VGSAGYSQTVGQSFVWDSSEKEGVSGQVPNREVRRRIEGV
jgi:hypothetical protein